VTERDPLGAALSAGRPVGRAPAENGEAANGQARNGEAGHQPKDGDELTGLDRVEDDDPERNDLEDDDLEDDRVEDNGVEDNGGLDDVDTEVAPGHGVAPGQAAYYEHAGGYGEVVATAEGGETADDDQVEYDDQGEALQYGGDAGGYGGEAGQYGEDTGGYGWEAGQYVEGGNEYYESISAGELDPEGTVLADGVGTGEQEVPVVAAGRRSTRSGGDSRRRQRRRRWTVAACVVAVAVVVVGVVGYVRVSNDINPGGRPGRAVTVAIPTGASTHKIASLLAGAGVIHGADVFELYTKLEGAGALLPGTYRLPTNEAYSAVLSALENGPPPVTGKLVVPEGFTIRQIAAAVGQLPGIGISAQSFIQAATSGQVRSPYEPPGANDLEGLLFPATYPVQKGETADYLVQYMVDTFDSYASQLGLTDAARALHYTPYQVITVASIVEREAKFDSDRGPIASAIYNRLSRHIPIGAESTLLYALGDPKGPVNMGTRSPYNTLIHVGLPPTPIANPGIPSLQAAMKPPTTGYIFWVEVNPDGKMGYASTEAGFVRLQAECKAAHLC
jgi:UPF0755 protein